MIAVRSPSHDSSALLIYSKHFCWTYCYGSCYNEPDIGAREEAMTRLQALLLALEISAIVWIGMFVGGKWVAGQSEIYSDVEISANIK